MLTLFSIDIMNCIIFCFGKLFIQMLLCLTEITVSLPRPPASPCPHIFTYERVPSLSDIIFPGKDQPFWKGVVHVPGHILSPGEGIFLKVLLAVPTTIPTKYVGRIEFRGNKEKLFAGKLDTVKYDVVFPNNCHVPHLLQVRVNDQILCNGLTPRATVVTKIILEHSLFPFRINFTARRSALEDFHFSSDKHRDVDSKLECGDSKSISNPLIVAGRSSAAGEWPWLVPIFVAGKNGRSVEFHCAGTLVSDRHIITAAHCLQDISDSGAIVVYVGRRSIRNWMDKESQPRGVTSIFIHPDFDSNTMYSDLAVLLLTSHVSWSTTVYPACMWTGPVDLNLVVGEIATVVGWGTDEAEKTKVTSEANASEMPIVSQEMCLRSHREFYFLSSNRTLCAGARDGSGPCNGDSGGGLYIPIKEKGRTRWYLRGVVSLSLVDTNTRRCDLYQYIVFTDVAQFLPWLRTVMR